MQMLHTKNQITNSENVALKRILTCLSKPTTKQCQEFCVHLELADKRFSCKCRNFNFNPGWRGGGLQTNNIINPAARFDARESH